MSARLLLILALALVAVPRPVSAQEAASTLSTDSRSGLEQEAFRSINAYRKDNGLPPLQWNAAIAGVARGHSRDMATGAVDFGHDGFRDRVTKISTALSGFQGAGENVFESSEADGVAQSAVAVWLKSPHHLRNIRGDYNYSGIGVWQSKSGVIYFTQIFYKLVPAAAPASSTAQAAPPAVTTPFGFLAAPTTQK